MCHLRNMLYGDIRGLYVLIYNVRSLFSTVKPGLVFLNNRSSCLVKDFSLTSNLISSLTFNSEPVIAGVIALYIIDPLLPNPNVLTICLVTFGIPIRDLTSVAL